MMFWEFKLCDKSRREGVYMYATHIDILVSKAGVCLFLQFVFVWWLGEYVEKKSLFHPADFLWNFPPSFISNLICFLLHGTAFHDQIEYDITFFYFHFLVRSK